MTGEAIDLVNFDGLRDRRTAASDEVIGTNTGRLFRRGSVARNRGPAGATGYDRVASDIFAVILHCISGSPLVRGSMNLLPLGPYSTAYEFQPYPPDQQGRYPILGRMTDDDPSSRHRIDRIAAHFVITRDGRIFYTRDMGFVVASAGGQHGVDVEFEGHFPCTPVPPGASSRLSIQAIVAGRRLIRALTQRLPALRYIHPHGQIQTHDHDRERTLVQCGGSTGNICDKLRSCPGPDIWVNVGKWAVEQPQALARPLRCESPDSYYQNNGIHQDIELYDQHVVSSI